MVDQQNISVIIMLCNLQEAKGAQCARYWPEDTDPDHLLDLAEHEIKFLAKQEIMDHLVERKLKLTRKSNNE
jgi:protein tyrosine phosphatase